VVSHKIRCRYRRGLTTDMRIICGTRRFSIVSIIDWEERHESLLIMAKELVE
jgi:head-tail adaptor